MGRSRSRGDDHHDLHGQTLPVVPGVGKRSYHRPEKRAARLAAQAVAKAERLAAEVIAEADKVARRGGEVCARCKVRLDKTKGAKSWQQN